MVWLEFLKLFPFVVQVPVMRDVDLQQPDKRDIDLFHLFPVKRFVQCLKLCQVDACNGELGVVFEQAPFLAGKAPERRIGYFVRLKNHRNAIFSMQR
jgi:hypothetical protein